MSRARRSVNLPLPSSPHWVPTTTVAALDSSSWPRCTSSLTQPITPDAELAEGDGSIEGVDDDRVAFVVDALEHRERQRVLEPALNDPLERARSEVGVEALARQLRRRAGRDLEREAAFGQSVSEPTQLDLDDDRQVLSLSERKRMMSSIRFTNSGRKNPDGSPARLLVMMSTTFVKSTVRPGRP